LKQQLPDVILLDLSLPDCQGLATLRGVLDSAGQAPVVVLTGTIDAALALQALTLGAQDYLLKDQLTQELVVRTLRYAIERRRIQHRLELTLREKDLLLRELGHRAKNNLQVIASLLSMQARRSDDQGFRALVDSARERIDSIALAHDQLQRSPNLDSIDFSAYLKSLAQAVHHSYGGTARAIQLGIDVGEHRLPLDRAITAGLIVNELLTNALKHAFPDDRAGHIRLSLRQHDRELELVVEDDGVGLSGHSPAAAQESGIRKPSDETRAALGLSLVMTLARQLEARVQRDGAGGTRLSLRFAARAST
jgi:two-component sensor histidine kinase